MKKIISLSLCFVLLLSLASCISLRPDGTTTVEPPSNTRQLPESTDVMTETIPETKPAVPETTEKMTESSPQTEPASETLEAKVPVIAPDGTYKPRVLMYHLIREEPYGIYENLFVRPSEFETHLSVLDELGYEYLFADEWQITNKPSVVITLDDGYVDNYTDMFPILKAHNAKATIFMVSDFIGTQGYLNEAMIKEMSDSGLVSIQCHTSHHLDLAYQTEEWLRSDFDEAVSRLSSITGKPVRSIAYPAGSYNDLVLSVAADYFDFAFTTESPFNVTEYTDLTIPRYYIARGYGREIFTNYVSY